MKYVACWAEGASWAYDVDTALGEMVKAFTRQYMPYSVRVGEIRHDEVQVFQLRNKET